MQKQLKNKLKYAIAGLLILYVMFGGLLYTFQEKILFIPEKLEDDYQFNFHYPFEELFFETENNGHINAIHFRVENTTPKGVILYFHGNAGSLRRWGVITEYFVEKGYDVLVMDYRSYGKSKGVLNENVMYSDAQHCYDYLKKYYAEEDITIYGRSLGTGIASYLASVNSPKQLILETPYYNITDVAQHRFPIFPVKQLLKYRFPSNEFLPNVKSPVTLLHGTEDRVVPFSSGKKLYDLGLENVEMVVIEGGNHNNLNSYTIYHETIVRILK